jgi:uncharacterized protein (TIGR02147 family)
MKAIDDQQLQFRSQLQMEFTRRCKTNSSYSLRAFAKQLGIHSSTLSQILAGKRRVSEKFISKMHIKIGLKIGNNSSDSTNYMLLNMDSFSVISNWYHYAILDLTLVKGFQSDSVWIAKKLNITIVEAKMAVERLIRLGMLTVRYGKLKLTSTYNTNYIEGQSSSAHKEYQRQIITKALEAIDMCPPEKKDITSIVIAANSKKIKESKEKIKKFRRELCAFLEDGEKDSVYHLALQLYPVTIYEEL